MLVFTDLDRDHPRFSGEQIEAAILKLPLEMFGVAERSGVSRDDGLKMARAKLADALRRELIRSADDGDNK
jgi:hypothetical protein